MRYLVRLSLEISISLLFFPFLFSSYCYSVDTRVVCVVSGRCNKSFLALFFYIVLGSLYRYIDAIFNADESSSSFFFFFFFFDT